MLKDQLYDQDLGYCSDGYFFQRSNDALRQRKATYSSPRPLNVRVVSSEQTIRFLAHELLALTKLNWNTTQFDGGDPVSIQASRVVGQVLRFCGDEQIIAPRYGFYM